MVAGLDRTGEGEFGAILFADAICTFGPTSLIQQRFGLFWIKLILFEVGFVVLATRRNIRMRHLSCAIPQVIDNALAVKGMHQRLATAFVSEIGPLVVDREVFDGITRGAENLKGGILLQRQAVFDQ